MTYVLRKDWFMFSPHMSIYDADERKCFAVRGRWFEVARTTYRFTAMEDRTLVTIVSSAGLLHNAYELFADGRRIGSVARNWNLSHEVILLEGFGRLELKLTDFLQRSFPVEGPDGIVADIQSQGYSWRIDILADCNHVHLLAAITVAYARRMREG